MDSLGGNGNGLAWYAADSADITNHAAYQTYSQQTFASIDANAVKAAIANSRGSAEAAPIVNYLRWILGNVEAIA